VLEFGAPPCEFPLYRTIDGGRTWAASPVTIGLGGRVVFTDRQRGIATSGSIGERWLTSDGGQSWNRAPAAGFEHDLHAIRFDSAGRGWVLLRSTRTRAMRSDDFGLSWRAVALPVADELHQPRLNDVHFADALHGWIVGDDGLVLATQDGGQTWVAQVSGTTRALRAVTAVEAGTAWIAGDNSIVLSTATGGR
jgi:photosystem II stability/assembly factor-like uncharacterized protein